MTDMFVTFLPRMVHTVLHGVFNTLLILRSTASAAKAQSTTYFSVHRLLDHHSTLLFYNRTSANCPEMFTDTLDILSCFLHKVLHMVCLKVAAFSVFQDPQKSLEITCSCLQKQLCLLHTDGVLADLLLHLRNIQAQHTILHLGSDLLQVCRLWQPHAALDPLRAALNPAQSRTFHVGIEQVRRFSIFPRQKAPSAKQQGYRERCKRHFTSAEHVDFSTQRSLARQLLLLLPDKYPDKVRLFFAITHLWYFTPFCSFSSSLDFFDSTDRLRTSPSMLTFTSFLSTPGMSALTSNAFGVYKIINRVLGIVPKNILILLDSGRDTWKACRNT